MKRYVTDELIKLLKKSRRTDQAVLIRELYGVEPTHPRYRCFQRRIQANVRNARQRDGVRIMNERVTQRRDVYRSYYWLDPRQAPS